jgi:mannosyltransferase
MRVTFRCDGTLFRGNGSIRNVMGLGDSYRSDAPPHLENIAAAMQENGKVTIEPNLSDASVSSGLSPDSGTTPTSVVVVAAAILAGMVLCLHGLGAKPIWFDEGWSLGCARLPLRDSLILALYEPVQWPYYLVLRAFLSLGDSESLLRLPSALFMIASIPMLFLSARRLFGTHAALAAALLMAVHADLVKYAHEVRGYGMEIFLLTTSLYLLCRYVEQPTFRRQLAYVAVCALAVYTHMYGILVIGAQLLCLFLVPPGTVRRKDTVLTLVSICALAAPMWLFAARVPRQYTIWMGMPTWSSVYLVLQHISGNAGALSVLLSAAGLLVAMLGFAGLLLDPAKKEEAWTLLLPVLSFTLPLVTTILASLLGRPCFLGRYMLFCVPALALMMASVIGRLPNLKLMAVATSLLVVVGLFGVWSYYQEDFDVDGGVRENYPELARFIASNAMPGDGIILYWAGMRVNYEYYLDRIPGSFACMDGKTSNF